MKRVKSISDDLRKEYTRSDFRGLERGKYYERVVANSNIVIIDPDVTAVFPNSSAVNEALHSLVEVAQRAARKRGHSTARGRYRSDVK